jgi:hypothetical protein
MNLHVRGVLLPDGVERDLFVVDGKFSLDPVADARTVLDGGWVVPGLVDVHAHLELASPAPPGTSPQQAARASAQAQLAAGVLALREPGGPARASTGIGPADAADAGRPGPPGGDGGKRQLTSCWLLAGHSCLKQVRAQPSSTNAKNRSESFTRSG